MTGTITNEPASVSIKVRRGSSLTFTATITDAAGNPINLTGHQARLGIRASPEAMTQLVSLAIGSGITLQGAGNNQLKVVLTPTQTRLLPVLDTVVYAFEREDGTGVVTPIFAGPVEVLPEIVT